MQHQIADDQRDLHKRRQDAVEGVRHQAGNAARAALDVAGQPAGLTVEVKAQRQPVQMPEDLERHIAHRALSDAGKDEFAQLGKEGRGKSQQAIGGQKAKWHRQQDGSLPAGRHQQVDDLLEHDRHADHRNLGRHQAGDRHQHAPAELPQIGKKTAQCFEVGALARAWCGRRQRG